MMDKTIEEQRQMVAERIMMWHIEQDHNYFVSRWSDNPPQDWWLNDGHTAGCPVHEWQPDQNITQAMMVTEALRKLGWRTELTSVPSLNEEPMSHEFEAIWCAKAGRGYYMGLHYDQRAATPEQAIFDVAVQIAERMEKEKDA